MPTVTSLDHENGFGSLTNTHSTKTKVIRKGNYTKRWKRDLGMTELMTSKDLVRP